MKQAFVWLAGYSRYRFPAFSRGAAAEKGTTRIGYLPLWPSDLDEIFKKEVKDAQKSVERFGMEFQPVVKRAPDKIEDAFSAMVRERTGALMVHPIFVAALGQGIRIAELAKKNRLPTISDGFRFGRQEA